MTHKLNVVVLNTKVVMDAFLGFRAAFRERQSFWRHQPQIAVHVGVGCQVPYEKASGKDPQVLLLSSSNRLRWKPI
jgi:hypothetical protein